MNKKQNNNQGFALLLALIISSIALSIGLSMLHIALKQLSLGTTTRGSEIAFQAASAGMECLRFTHNDTSNDFLSGSIVLDCLVSSPVNISNSGSGDVYRYRYQTLDWGVTGGDLCIDIDTYVIDASAGDVTYTFPNGDKTCIHGDMCTFGFARGYNRSCGEIASSIFTVQRELTVEF